MKKRERIEWCDVWVTGANVNDLPRVLLVGDSITRSYYPHVEEALAGNFLCARLATSKCICDPTFKKELDLVLREYRFSVIHFNNGLHGWDYSEAAYRNSFPRILDFITRRHPESRVIWASSTPVRTVEDLTVLHANTKRVRERNRIAAECASARKIPINDLFSMVEGRPEHFSADGVHFTPDGQKVLGEQVADFILKHGRAPAPQ